MRLLMDIDVVLDAVLEGAPLAPKGEKPPFSRLQRGGP
ncbi:hypothetical protein BH23GEM4_BH23GEM4_23720 [soil metagenome]